MANGSLWDINSSASAWLLWACFWLLIYMASGLEKIEENTGLYWAYGGILIQFALTQMAAMYVGVGTTNTIMSRAGGSAFYYSYRGGSEIGDFLGLYGMLSSFLFYIWAVAVSLMGYYEGDAMIVQVRKLSKAGKIETMEGFKLLLTGFLVGIGAWVSGVILREQSTTQLLWYSTYNTKSEGTNDDGTRDTDGTSFTLDFIYQTVSLVFTLAIGAVPHAAAAYMGLQLLKIEGPFGLI